MTMMLTSPVFAERGPIPAAYTRDGDDLSLPLSWSGVPATTKSLALVVDDPDAPHDGEGAWVHWIVYDIPADEVCLEDGASSGALPPGAREGLNDWRHAGWTGPSVTSRHRYRCTLYALDAVLPDLYLPTREGLERAMAGHVLASAELVGTYEGRH